MALDILEALVSFLCPTNEAASSCREFIQNHSSVLPPIGPLFYFLLFPLIFTILFVYIISDKVLFGGSLKWAKVLIGVSAFIFIIISGLYPVALVLSEFWYIFIVILGVFWFLFSHKKGGGAPKAGGSMPGLNIGSVTGAFLQRGKSELTGQRKRLETQVDIALNEMERIIKVLHNDPGSWRSYSAEIENCRSLITQYYNIVSVGNIPIGGDAKKKVERLEQILSKLDKNKS